MDGLCTWGGGCMYAGTQVCSCTCGGWRATLEYHPLFPSCFETRLPTAPRGYQLAGSAGQQSSNFPVSSFQSVITEVNHHAQFFLWGPGFQSLVFIPKKGTISSPSHLSSPHGSFQYFKNVDPLFLPLHCLPQNNKEKSISCERRE